QSTLFLSRHPPPRLLLPFPTRRSSDLERGGDYGEYLPPAAREPGPAGSAPPGAGPRAAPASSSSSPPPSSASSAASSRGALKQEDRKSTRLNSSHVSISSAVFCLNKKK